MQGACSLAYALLVCPSTCLHAFLVFSCICPPSVPWHTCLHAFLVFSCVCSPSVPWHTYLHAFLVFSCVCSPSVPRHTCLSLQRVPKPSTLLTCGLTHLWPYSPVALLTCGLTHLWPYSPVALAFWSRCLIPACPLHLAPRLCCGDPSIIPCRPGALPDLWFITRRLA